MSKLVQLKDNEGNIYPVLPKQFGKLLWSGSFSSGSITVEGLNNYTVFLFVLSPSIYCIGSKTWGIGGIGSYGSYAATIYNYRFDTNGNTLTISSTSRGGSNGSANTPVTAIYGLF